MQLWEYATVTVQNNVIFEVGVPNPTIISVGLSLTDCLTDLGNYGWEMTGVAGNTANNYRVFFKRPK